MAVQTSYDRISGTIDLDLARRDLEAAVHMTVWEDAPIQRLTGVGARPVNRHFEWHVRDLTSPSAVTSKYENNTITASAHNLPKILANALHYDYRAYFATGTDMALPLSYSGRNALEDQGMIASRELVMQTDFNHLWSTYQVGVAATTERQQIGLIQWLLTTGGQRLLNTGESTPTATCTLGPNTGSGAIPAYALTHAAVNAQGTAMTAEILNSKLQTPRESGLKVSDLTFFVSPAIKVYIDALMMRVVDVNGYTNLLKYERPIDSRMIGNQVNFIQTTWGVVPIIEIKHLAGETQAVALTGSTYDYTVNGSNCILGLKMSDIQQRVLRPYEEMVMARTGDQETRAIVYEGGLQVGNPANHFLYLNVTGADDPTP